MRASRLAALVGESEGVDVEPTAASSCIRTAGIEGKHDRRSSVGAGRDDEETAGPADSRRLRPIPVDKEVSGGEATPVVVFDLFPSSSSSGTTTAGATPPRRPPERREQVGKGRGAGEHEWKRGERGQRRAALSTERGGGPWGTAARPRRHGERGMAPGPSVATVRRKGKRRDRQEGPTVRSLTLFHFSFSDF